MRASGTLSDDAVPTYADLRPVGSRCWVFASLANRNYRRYFAGQAVSLPGTWMQSIAQSWLVVQLTGSGTMLGLLVAMQTLPVLLLTPYAGVLVDRADKRKLLLGTQSAQALLALGLGTLTVTHVVRLWMVFTLAAGLGLVTSLDNPGRQAFVVEMVGTADLLNAVSLNSLLVNAARAVGPAVAGVLILLVGVGACFLINAATFVAIIAALASMNRSQLHPAPPAPHTAGQLRDGFRHVRRMPALRIPLLMMALIGTFAYEFQVVLPLLAQRTFSGNADTYGYLTATLGAGAVLGGLVVVSVRTGGLSAVVATGGLFGAALLAAAVAPGLRLEIAALAAAGGASVAFMAYGNTTLQLAADPSMRGRVMALWTVAFLGTTPIGGPVVGYVAQHAGPRWALTLGGVAALLAAALGGFARLRGEQPAPAGAGVQRPAALEASSTDETGMR